MCTADLLGEKIIGVMIPIALLAVILLILGALFWPILLWIGCWILVASALGIVIGFVFLMFDI